MRLGSLRCVAVLVNAGLCRDGTFVPQYLRTKSFLTPIRLPQLGSHTAVCPLFCRNPGLVAFSTHSLLPLRSPCWIRGFVSGRRLFVILETSERVGRSFTQDTANFFLSIGRNLSPLLRSKTTLPHLCVARIFVSVPPSWCAGSDSCLSPLPLPPPC